MGNKSGWIGGQNERQHDIDRRRDEQASVDHARREMDERRRRGQDAMIQLAKAKEQLLALSLWLRQRSALEERAGQYELADWLMVVSRCARDIRANQTVPELEEVGREVQHSGV